MSVLDRTKIVVWDLDDTFWDGTLAEGDEVTYLREHHDLVLRLNRYGIISSIASHNDRDRARSVLERHGIWPSFVFPQIGWEPKHEMVARLLAQARLRPDNAFFIDDKTRVREAVLAHVPRLLGAGTREELASAFNQWALERSESDPGMTRLAQYKLLERRESARNELVGRHDQSATDFLRSSAIRCRLLPIHHGLFDRILELVNRTNQLNFTRKRLDAAGLRALLERHDVECRGVHVKDRFGDYGIAGFFALDTSRHVLEHFLFSCRILQMGVEQAVYEHLSRPALEIEGQERPFAGGLPRGERVDWIAISDAPDGAAEGEDEPTVPAPRRSKPARVLFVGPCDLLAVSDQMAEALPGRVELASRVVYTNDSGRVISHFGHDAMLRLALDRRLRRTHADTLERLVWLDERLMTLPALGTTDVIVLSSIRNAQAATYTHRTGEFSVPFEYTRYDQWKDITRPEHKEKFIQVLRNYHRVDHRAVAPSALESLFEYFREHFTFTGLVSGSAYKSTLLRLSGALRDRQRLLVLNCAQVPGDWIRAASPTLQRIADQHAEINRAIEDAAREDSRIGVLDINAFVGDEEGFSPPRPGRYGRPWYRLYHFERSVYVGLAREIVARLDEWGFVKDAVTGEMRRTMAATAITRAGYSHGSHDDCHPELQQGPLHRADDRQPAQAERSRLARHHHG